MEGLNLAHHYVRPDPKRKIPGGIVKKEAFMNISNVMLVNPVTNEADRVGFKISEEGKKVRYFKLNKEWLEL